MELGLPGHHVGVMATSIAVPPVPRRLGGLGVAPHYRVFLNLCVSISVEPVMWEPTGNVGTLGRCVPLQYSI